MASFGQLLFDVGLGAVTLSIVAITRQRIGSIRISRNVAVVALVCSVAILVAGLALTANGVSIADL